MRLTVLTSELQTRSWALLHNFWPYCLRAKAPEIYQSPAYKLNGFVYRDNWLENLLVATSFQGFHVRPIPKNNDPELMPFRELARGFFKTGRII
ncbi:MAG: hypothetical protein GY796_10415 [Chloroflexi bacterium]|nr:hypothetical protein [Chloroflexota bacterium]